MNNQEAICPSNFFEVGGIKNNYFIVKYCLTFIKIQCCALRMSKSQMSQSTAKPTMSHVHPAKTQISLHNCIAPDKKWYQHITFSYFSSKMYAVRTHQIRLTEALLLSTHALHVFVENCFGAENRLMWSYATAQSGKFFI